MFERQIREWAKHKRCALRSPNDKAASQNKRPRLSASVEEDTILLPRVTSAPPPAAEETQHHPSIVDAFDEGLNDDDIAPFV